MARKCLIFVYGLLQTAHRPPRSVSAASPDALRGDLYDLGEHPAAVRLGLGEETFEGELLEIDEDELPTLDEFEDTEGGEYVRKLVATESGALAWAYEYLREIPAGLARLKKWGGPGA